MIFSTIRSLLAAFAFLAGIGAYFQIRNYWPAIFDEARFAFVLLGVAISLFIIREGLQARARTYSGLAMGAALIGASIAALYAPINYAYGLVEYFFQWRSAGYGLLDSFNNVVAQAPSLSQLQTTALWTGLAIGLPIPLVAVLIWLTGFIVTPQTRISKSGPWRAQWLGNREIKQLKHNATGLPLGLLNGAILRYRPNAKQGWRQGHHAVIAGTRAGKGVSAVIPAIIDHKGSVVVLDIKGENFAITRRHRESLGRRVVVLNPFGVNEPMQDQFNPLDYIRRDHLVRDTDVIAEGLVRPEQGNGAHFADIAKTLVSTAIMVAIRTKTSPNLATVMEILFSPNFIDTLNSWANDPATYGKNAAQTAATFLAAGEPEKGAIRTTIKKAFDWARSDEMETFLSGTNWKLDDIFSDKADLYIVVPLDQIDTQSVFLRLITNIILGMAVRQEGARKSRENVLLVLDEFVRLGRMEKLVNIANVAAGAGIEALFVTQDKGQIESVYGRGDTASILGSCVTIRIFGLGRAESETAKWASEALGDQTIITKTIQSSKRLGERTGTTTGEQRQKMMTTDQILEMPSGEMLVLMGSKRPLKLRAIVSYQHTRYRRRLSVIGGAEY